MVSLSIPGPLGRRHIEKRKYCDEEYITRIHKLMTENNLFFPNTALEIVDTHRAYPYYDSSRNTIVFDIHFLDILRMVTASFGVRNSELMEAIADYCTADYFLCRDEVYLAFKYARCFSKKKRHLEQLIESDSKKLQACFHRQLFFVLYHEQGHAKYLNNPDDPYFIPLSRLFEEELNSLNAATKQIQAIDISPIKADLDKIKDKYNINDTFDYTSKKIKEAFDKAFAIKKIVNKGLKCIRQPLKDPLAPGEALYHACDSYLKGANHHYLEADQYREDCLADGYTLERLLMSQLGEEDYFARITDTIFAYYTCLLTMNIITCVNTCVMHYRSEGYSSEDLVWNRLRIERLIFNNTIRDFAFRKARGFLMAEQAFAYAESLVDIYTELYARFCERVYAVDHPTNDTPYCCCLSPHYEEMYVQIQKMLFLQL